PFEREELEHCFLHVTRGNELIPDLLAKLSLFLREQTERCRILPFVGVGILFRTVYERKELEKPEMETIDAALVSEDVTAIVQQACSDVRRQTTQKYVESEKVAGKIFELYFCVIHEALCNKFIGKDGQDSSLFKSLQQRLPELTKEEYSKLH